jgi:hypothetical protein
VRSIFYTVAILASLGAIGVVVSNPPIVQQGAALLGFLNDDINKPNDDNEITDDNMLSQFLNPNEQKQNEPNAINTTNTTTPPYPNLNTSNPPSIKTSPFPTFPSTSTSPSTPANNTQLNSETTTSNPTSTSSTPVSSNPFATFIETPIPNQTPTPTPTPTPISNPNQNPNQNPTSTSASSPNSPYKFTTSPETQHNHDPAILTTNIFPTTSPDNSTPQNSTLPNSPTLPPSDIFSLQDLNQPPTTATTTTKNNAAIPEKKITNNAINDNIDTFDQWSDPVPLDSTLSNLPATITAANHTLPTTPEHNNINPPANDPFSSQKISVLNDKQTNANNNNPNQIGNDIFGNNSNNTNNIVDGFLPVNSNSIFPETTPPANSPLVPPPVPPATTLPVTPSVATPLPPVGSLATQKLQHGSELAINPSVISEEVSCIGTETVARVGCEVILMCDILPQLRRFGHRVLRENLNSLTPEQREAVTAEEKDLMLAKCIEVNYKEFLKMQIEGSLVYNDFLMSVPREQILANEKRLNDEFDRKDVPAMIKEFGVRDNVELKRYLEDGLGSSLERERMLSTRNKIIQMWVARSIQDWDADLTCDELNEYYREHLDEFTTKERVQWKEMVVSFSKFNNKQEALNKITWLLNEVKRGVNFEGLAKLNSDGLTAPEGGIRNWTKKGELSSKIIENIIFDMPIMQLSNIIESENGFHIIIVTDREKEKTTPFIDAQTTIRKKIRTERLQKKQTEYFENLKQKYPVIVLRKDLNINMAKPINRPLN